MDILVLGEAASRLPLQGRYEIRRASSPSEARRAYDARRPDMLVIGMSDWARSFVSELSPEVRPATLGFAPSSQWDALLTDDWVGPSASAEEWLTRGRIAMGRARERRRMSRRAMVDALTGLPNRRAAIRGLIHAAARARRTDGALSVVLIDLDDFKRVNDTLGHDGGDRLLRHIGAVLAREVRRDELCARIGGDEFLILITDGLDAAQAAAQRVLSALDSSAISATAATAELHVGEQLRALYRRVDEELKARKGQRAPSSGTHAAASRRPLPPPEPQHGDAGHSSALSS
jgi:diguanylate cyclase (GGDEF)-like protein